MHVTVTEEVKKGMINPGACHSPPPKPLANGSNSSSPGDCGASRGSPRYCRFFLNGVCKRGEECHYPHVSEEEAKRMDKAAERPIPRVKAKTMPQPAPLLKEFVTHAFDNKAKLNPQKNLAPTAVEMSNSWQGLADE